MSELMPLGTESSLSLRQARRAARQISAMEVDTELRLRRVEQAAEVEAGKVEAIGYVAKRGMFVVGSVTQTEQHVGQLVPMAASRLQAIGDMAAFAVTEVLADLQPKLRRV
jgi:hypothetical protein